MLRDRKVSAREVATAFLDRAESTRELYGAYLHIDREWTLSQADAAQAKLDNGTAGPLTGVPVAIKDNISTAGQPTTCASKILDGYIPPYDATSMAKLKEAGLVAVGKTNLDEFAMGASNENSSAFPAKNPWDISRVPGGSSGGSAAAVAGRTAPVSLGSDTGGSIRQPAALCGIVGFKPTYGRVSRYGLVAFGSSLDQIGPMAHTVSDAALLAQAISGYDDRDATSLQMPSIDASRVQEGSIKGKRIAVPKELFAQGAEPGVLEAVHRAMDQLRAAGVEFVEVSVPEIELGVTTYYIIAPAEASSNLARFDGIRYGPRMEATGHVGTVAATRGQLFGHEVKARIMIGTYVLSAGYYDAFYLRAQQLRGKMAAHLDEVLQGCDAIIGPTSPVVAFPLGGLSQDPMAMKLVDYCTIPANMGGFPAISMPCGLSEGLPVGLQLMGRVTEDEALLQLAWQVEQALGPQAQPNLGLTQ